MFDTLIGRMTLKIYVYRFEVVHNAKERNDIGRGIAFQLLDFPEKTRFPRACTQAERSETHVITIKQDLEETPLRHQKFRKQSPKKLQPHSRESTLRTQRVGGAISRQPNWLKPKKAMVRDRGFFEDQMSKKNQKFARCHTNQVYSKRCK
ncbi:hypothetical protein K0M31_007135 [Melipona bicolor]|uniref:Uncharacterized protein n=1 Tax=Melipona bicolor TaxID=60889 RepID=A0AA40FSK8_9HYME|nr:hypothetical protein K0M31_007135 [Melipona bicolor]